MPSSKMSSPSTPFSPAGRIKRTTRTLDESQRIYEEVLTIGGPKLQTAEGKELLAHTDTGLYAVWQYVCILAQVCGI